MPKTYIAGILIVIVAVGSAVLDYLQGRPVDYPGTIEKVSAGFGLIFLRKSVQKAIDVKATP